MSYDAVDLFAGPGGWSEGLRTLGLSELGIDSDQAACDTAEAAGHARRKLDIAATDPRDYAGVPLLIASPPCPGFSAAGKGLGRKDFDLLVGAIDMIGTGFDAEAVLDGVRVRQHDPRSALTLEPLRWALDLMPEWIALEQVPAVLPLWQAYVPVLQARGYHVWAGNLHAEQYGVPQTRKRAVLMASRRSVAAPTPTHSRYYSHMPAKLDEGVSKWVSMAEALGWGMTHRPSMTVTGGGSSTGGAEPFGNAARQGMLRELEAGRWELASRRDSPKWVTENGTRENRPMDRPAVTITGESHRWSWQFCGAGSTARFTAGQIPRDLDEPAHTITGAGTAAWTTAGVAETVRRITVQEAAILQSFPHDYPWQGKQGKQFQQVGNAVPPLLAAHVLAALTGAELGEAAA